jgi:DNA-directed RNA polymerase specialized sigma24 family protein
VGEYLRTKRSDLNLNEVGSDELAYRADLDEKILFEERLALVLKIVASELTGHERKLFELMRKGLEANEIAQELGIKVASVHREKHALLKKLHELVGRGDGGDGEEESEKMKKVDQENPRKSL